MDHSSSVDTLVYQLEDDDPHVRWDTLQRLRKRAAVERAQLPVRNPRRFLHCLRRRLSDHDPRIAHETLLLLCDVVDVLRDDVDQIFSSILPHLIPRLPDSGGEERNGTVLHEETFLVLRKYVNVSNDLAGAATLVVDLGLAHKNASVRVASLLSLGRLLDERYGRRTGVSKRGTARIDIKLFTELVQAVMPAMEDVDEHVVVAAEEAIAKIQVLWGEMGFQQVLASLSKQDIVTLQHHDVTIRAFANAATSEPGVAVSMSASQVLQLRASLAVAPSLLAATTLRFGFVPAHVVEALTANAGNSNAEWKRRTAAVEQLYAAAKQVDFRVLRAAARGGGGDASDSLVELIALLLRLLQDIDVHLVKRSMQVQRLVFYKLEPVDHDNDHEPLDPNQLVLLMERAMPALVEATANYAEDSEITLHAYTLFQTLFSGQLLSVAALSRALLSSMSHRRLQVREEALKVWIVLLLTAQSLAASTDGVLGDDRVVDALGRALGDGSSRVRHMAMELAAVLAAATRQDVGAIVERRVDEYTLERVNLDALYARTRDTRLPTLLENGQLQLKAPQYEPATKAAQTRSPVRASGQSAPPDVGGRQSTRTSSGALAGQSKLLEQLTSSTEKTRPSGEWPSNESADVVTSHSPSDGFHLDHGHRQQREVTSAPSEQPIVDNLQALKRKTELLKKSASSRQVLGSSRQFNPQEGDCDFASAGYAAQQDPPPLVSQQRVAKSSRRPVRGEDQQESDQDIYSYREVSTKKDTKTVTIKRAPVGKSRGDAPLEPGPMADSPRSPEDRPIRPMRAINYDEFAVAGTDGAVSGAQATTTVRAAPMSLATKRRLEAKLKQDAALSDEPNGHALAAEPSPEAAVTPRAPARPISLATRKRMEARAKTDPDSDPDDHREMPTKRYSVGGAAGGSEGGVPEARGKQEPKYLDAHELLPFKDPGKDASKVVAQLRSDDWEVSFEAMNVVRRLATHHPTLLEDKLRGVVAELLKQVPNLRSSITKNATLALNSLCSAYGKQLDAEVDNIVPVLMKRCTDSSAFVCESVSLAITAVILCCSTGRVSHAIAAHVTSRAIAIRREVARAIHTVIVGLADQVHSCKEFPTMLQTVAKCLADSNNEVRDAAKQSIVYLCNEQTMNPEALKRMLPASVHAKVDALGLRKAPTGSLRPVHIVKPSQSTAVATRETKVAAATGKQAPPASGHGNVPCRASVVVDADALAVLTTKLESSNWKDRFDGLNETCEFVHRFAASLCESGKLVLLFDSILKRMEDGNAKVGTLALELLPAVIASLGDGMALVLQAFVPALARGLTASNARQAALAHAALQTLCATVDAKLLCQHVAAVAKNATSRIKPALLDALATLAARSEDRNQFALTRYVLPLALELLKEGKSDVKDVTARLLRSLYASLGNAVLHAATKLSAAQQDKLAAIVGVRR